MDGLIARAKKLASGAGEIQEGQRCAGARAEKLSRWLGWGSAAISAAVGTSIFTGWIEAEPTPFGIAAVAAATISAIQRTAKLDEKAEDYRLAGVKYGELRRRIDMFRLRLEVEKKVELKERLAKLDHFGDDLSKLAKETRTLQNSIYEPAAAAFEETHSEYYPDPDEPTHAGGVVWRRTASTIQYLVVQAKNVPRDWVLPKGHISPGESMEQTAQREVMEEAGVETTIRKVIDTVEFSTPQEHVISRFFLMDAISEGQAQEGRERKWLSLVDAIDILQFKEAQQLICQAHTLLRRSASSRG
jgi:ADP-ribose pyrophosphatase YjhB (NUDIX family)